MIRQLIRLALVILVLLCVACAKSLPECDSGSSKDKLIQALGLSKNHANSDVFSVHTQSKNTKTLVVECTAELRDGDEVTRPIAYKLEYNKDGYLQVKPH